MKSTSSLFGLALILFSIAGSSPIKVSTTLSPRPYFVGQGIEIRVDVDAGLQDWSVEPIKIPGAEVHPLPIDPASRSSRRFVMVAGHAGTIDLPAIRVRSGDRSGSLKPVRLAVASVPTEGRTSAFLGGVGAFELQAIAEPASVRVGDTLQYRVKVVGPAAFGSVRPPDLGGWGSASLEVEPIESAIEVNESASRTFRYRLRPLKSGPLKLPPVAIASFDPRTRRYLTRATSSLTVPVEELPRFDPSRLNYAPVSIEARAWWTEPAVLVIVLAVMGLVSGVVTWSFLRRARVSRVALPRKLALELARGLRTDRVVDEVEAARAVTDALTTFLHQVSGREPGVLTPPEARLGFDRLTSDADRSSWAGSLVARCDRSRYGWLGGDEEAKGLIEEGRRFFETLAAGKVINQPGQGGRPGEAVETTSAS